MKKTIYRGSKQAVLDRIRLAYAAARADAVGSDDAMIRAGGFARLLDAAEHYDAPVFPVTGSDLLALGIEKAPVLEKHCGLSKLSGLTPVLVLTVPRFWTNLIAVRAVSL